jgi:hypothetical protein
MQAIIVLSPLFGETIGVVAAIFVMRRLAFRFDHARPCDRRWSPARLGDFPFDILLPVALPPIGF